MLNVIGLIHPDSARHHRSKALCNNPNVIVNDIRPYYSKNGWYAGEFKVVKKTDVFEAGHIGVICGFRPRRIKG